MEKRCPPPHVLEVEVHHSSHGTRSSAKKRKRKRSLRVDALVWTLAVPVCLSLHSAFRALPCSLSDNHGDEFAVQAGALNFSPPSPPSNASLRASSSNISTALAYEQSNGLFDDISDTNWELLRKKTHDAHSLGPPDRQEHIENPLLAYFLGLQPDFTCPYESRLGGLDSRALRTCNVHRLTDQPECLIYSFGSNHGSFLWEDALVDRLQSTHCEIHVFDEHDYARAGDEELKNIHFHQWGIKSSYHTTFNTLLTKNARRIGTEVDFFTFQETRAKLGHENRTIDILRMDDHERRGEWATYKDWVTAADVRQLLVSSHGTPVFTGTLNMASQRFLVENFVSTFKAQGFVMFALEWGKYGFDVSFVKLHQEFWRSGDIDLRLQRRVFMPAITIPDPVVVDAPYRIPRKIVYVHNTNLLEVGDPADSFFTVWHSLQKYEKAWNMSKTDLAWFVDDITCLAALHQNKPELAPFFWAETDASHKKDVCGLMALYLHGGYYFNIDFEVQSPYTAPDDSVLVLARDDDRHLSRQFMASEPKSPVTMGALDNILHAYKRNTTGNVDFSLGTEALSASVKSSLSTMVPAEYVQLHEIGANPPPWIAPIPPADLFVNAIPENMRGPPPLDAKIPRRLIFTYKNNLLETKEPTVLYENVHKTIDLYRKAWDDPNAPVWFLDDNDCRSAIYAAKPGLVSYFDREPEGAFKADICRVAALYLTGGVYSDVDMEAVNAWMPARNVSFATAIDPGKTCYFQSFLASEPKGRIMEEALDELLHFYEKRTLREKVMIGPDTLKWAVESVPPSEVGETVILEEVGFDEEESESQLRREAVGCCCHFKVQTPDTQEIMFYSRAVGAGSSCYARDSPEGQAYLKAQVDV